MPRIPVHVFAANESQVNADSPDVLDHVVIVITMSGRDLTKIQAGLSCLADMATTIPGAGEIVRDLKPIIADLATLHFA